jgi:hypothetical protein
VTFAVDVAVAGPGAAIDLSTGWEPHDRRWGLVLRIGHPLFGDVALGLLPADAERFYSALREKIAELRQAVIEEKDGGPCPGCPRCAPPPPREPRGGVICEKCGVPYLPVSDAIECPRCPGGAP